MYSMLLIKWFHIGPVTGVGVRSIGRCSNSVLAQFQVLGQLYWPKDTEDLQLMHLIVDP